MAWTSAPECHVLGGVRMGIPWTWAQSPTRALTRGLLPTHRAEGAVPVTMNDSSRFRSKAFWIPLKQSFSTMPRVTSWANTVVEAVLRIVGCSAASATATR